MHYDFIMREPSADAKSGFHFPYSDALRFLLNISAVFAAVFILAGLPLLIVPGYETLDFEPSRIPEAALRWLNGLSNGSSFDFQIGDTPWNLLELAPGFFLVSFMYTSIPGFIGIALGTLGGISMRSRKRGITDRFADFALAFPDFLLVIILQIIAVELSVASIAEIPIANTGSTPSLLPMLVMIVGPFWFSFRASAEKSRTLRLESFVTFARAKGLPESAVLTRHIGAAVIPNIFHELPTIIAFMQGSLFIVEQAFGLPGMAALLFRAAFARANRGFRRENYQYQMVVFALLGSVVVCVLTYITLRIALMFARMLITHLSRARMRTR